MEGATKSYNPFKMWGSWVGFGVPLILTILFFMIFMMGKNFDILFELLIIIGFPIIYILNPILEPMASFIWVPISAIIIGFLMGWGIHSLIRRFKK